MYLYFLKRILLIFPTLFIIMLVNFLIIQSAPGGPVEQFIAKLNHGTKVEGEVAAQNFSAINNSQNYLDSASKYRGSNGIDPEIITKIEKLYGFDLPLWKRFSLMMKKFITFDFGVSFYQDKKVTELVLQKLPTSISIGLWSTLLIYLISIPLGIKKAINDGSKFDITSSTIVIIAHAIPSFLFAIFLITIFAGGNFLNIFPLRGLVSDNFSDLNWWQKIIDYFWHMTLPIMALTIGGFASLTFFCKNSFLEEINKQYVITAYAKGLDQKTVLYIHVFRNALMIIIAGFPAALIGILFSGSMLIEIIFSLDGLGLLGYEAATSRDYPVMFGTLYCFTLIGLITSIISDFIYHIVDPRINFSSLN
ncbi:MAG: microcin C ABC transporter permease YejB [Rickettsiales bacterium]|nr:microcin C ABC transporter permease YejB [Rickettsiales bacterium]